MTVLQTAPLPLGYDAIAIKSEVSSRDPSSERWDSNPRPSRWQRDALPAELLSQKTLILKRLRAKFYIKYLCITTFFILMIRRTITIMIMRHLKLRRANFFNFQFTLIYNLKHTYITINISTKLYLIN